MWTVIAAGLLQTANPAQAAPPADAPRQGDIVITGHPLSETDAALKACLARHCPPLEDIGASLAHAENLFVAGRYQDARNILLAARHRDARYASKYPVEVAGLHRANARLASLSGEPNLSRIGMVDSLDALKAGLPDTDPRVMMQKLEVGDAFAKTGRIDAATQMYDEVARAAHRAGAVAVEGHALFRTAILYAAIASLRPEYKGDLERVAKKITDTTDPSLQPFRDGVMLLRARLANEGGDKGSIDRFIKDYQRHPAKVPVLLYAPAPRMNEVDSNNLDGGGPIDSRRRGDDQAQWMDVGFWIAPDGSVRDADILRHSDHFEDYWSKPVLKALALRRYAPLALDANDPGLLRVERYSRVSDVEYRLGSHITTRSPYPRIETLDLTAPTPQQAARTPATPG